MSQFFASGGQSIGVSASASVLPMNMISFRMDWLDLLAVQGVLKSLLQHHSSKASILQCSAFFMVQLSHPYGKTIALTIWTFVGKVMFLLFNMLFRFVIAFLPSSFPSRTNTRKGCLFHHRVLECKSRKSRDTWSNRHIWPWSTK